MVEARMSKTRRHHRTKQQIEGELEQLLAIEQLHDEWPKRTLPADQFPPMQDRKEDDHADE
jgi:hypothetical protein